jgi:hypothetical protein
MQRLASRPVAFQLGSQHLRRRQGWQGVAGVQSQAPLVQALALHSRSSSFPPPSRAARQRQPHGIAATRNLSWWTDVKDRVGSPAELRESASGVAKMVSEKLFAKDETTWNDALRKVFGLKPKDKPVEAWHDAVDEKTGKRYQYNDAGDTRWASSNPASATAAEDAASQQPKPPQQSPEEEARAFVEAHRQQGPSLYEQQLAELGAKMKALEDEREAAQNASDMPKFKELNKQVRDTRKEIEAITAKMNSTSVVLKEEHKGAWEQFSDRLKDTPLLKGIFGLGDSSAGKKLSDAAEDAREAWETSQHPLIYRAHSAWSTMFAETEMGEAIRELRKLDPDFTMEGFLVEMEEEIIPTVLGAFLRADKKAMRPWLGEAAMGAVGASIDERRRAQRVMDPNILAIQHVNVHAAKVVEKLGPLVVVQFMAQQIDCLYDAKGGAVVEGSDNRVAAVFYAFAMTRDRDPDSGEALNWSIKEFAIVGSLPWR